MNDNTQLNDNADGIVDAALSHQEETIMNTTSDQTESLATQLRAHLTQRLNGDLDDTTLRLLDQLDEAERVARAMQGLCATIRAGVEAKRETGELEDFDDDFDEFLDELGEDEDYVELGDDEDDEEFLEELGEDDELQAEISTPVCEVVEIPHLPGLEPEHPVCWFVDQAQAEQRAYQLTVAHVWARRYFVRQVDVRRVSSPYAEVSLE